MSISAQSKPQGLIDLCANIPDATPEAITVADKLWVSIYLEHEERLGLPPLNTGAQHLHELLGIGINPHLLDKALIQATLLSPVMFCSSPEPRLCREINERIEKEIGKPVLNILKGMMELRKLRELIELEVDEQADLAGLVEDFNVVRNRRILFALNRDLRAVFLRLAVVGNRLHNQRMIRTPRELRIDLIELAKYLIPVASILCPNQYKMRLEDLAFQRLLPEQYSRAEALLSEGHLHREEATRSLIRDIRGILVSEGIVGDVSGRPKSLSSFFRKHFGRGVPLEEIFDLKAIRVVVRDSEENFPEGKPPDDRKSREKHLTGLCYRLCAVLNERFKLYQYEDEFKFSDYILKPSGDLSYKSLHMVMEDDSGDVFEIQVRTAKMDEEAEFGPFAHFLYKEKRKLDYTDLELLEIRRAVLSSEPVEGGIAVLNERLSGNSKLNSVLVLTPEDEIVLVPEGGTVLDFAYGLHSSVGHRTRLAKVNDQAVPLGTKLRNFDRVEIVTGKKPQPSREWLNILVSKKAQRHIRTHLDLKGTPHHAEVGHQEFHDAVARRRTGALDLTEKKQLHALMRSEGFDRENEFFHMIGTGDLDAGAVVDNFLVRHGERELKYKLKTAGLDRIEVIGSLEMERVLLDEFDYDRRDKFFIDINSGELRTGPVVDFLKGYIIESLRHKRKKHEFKPTTSSYGVMVGNLSTNTHIKMAGCCLPVLGDEILGYVSRGGVITIHRQDCRYLSSGAFDKERFISAMWLPDPENDGADAPRRRFSAKVKVEAMDRQGLLADLTNTINREDVSIEDLKMDKPHGLSTMIGLSMLVRDKPHLERVTKKISAIDGVLRCNITGR